MPARNVTSIAGGCFIIGCKSETDVKIQAVKKLCLSRAAWQGEAREDREAGHANLSLAPVGNSAYSRYHVARYAPHGVLLSCLAYIP